MATETPWFVHDSKIGAALQDLKDVSSAPSALDDKTKELIKLVVASVMRCDHCTHSHLKKALAVGVTKRQVTEALLIAAMQTAATQMSWHKEMFEKYLTER
jgi:AhpD family alkylhydroperoxidase